MNIEKFDSSPYKGRIESTVRSCEQIRKDKGRDVSLADFFKLSDNVTMDAVYESLGIDPSIDTIENIFTTPDESVRWLIPEIIRDALRLGMRKAPIYPSVIASEQTVKQRSVTLPHLNMSDAMPKYVGEAETIKLGNISYGQKTLNIRKMGRGIKIPYEVKQYVSIDVVAIFLQDFGIKLGHGIDGLLIDVLLNGEQANGSESAPVVGIESTAAGLTYRDLIRVWVRGSRIGKNYRVIVAGEDMAIDTLDLDEFKKREAGTTEATLNLKTPIPKTADMHIHGAMPADQLLAIDPSSTVIKYNAQPLLVESEKIVSNQTEATYATLTTGFGIVFRDSRIVIDRSLQIDFGTGTNYFPAYMDVDALENVTIED